VNGPRSDEIHTLEPLIEAIRKGVESSGWELSGLQKTTSHQFEGRWEGESTRSAYVFFHPPDGPSFVSIDVYLDETSRGLSGNAALVADLVSLGDLGEAAPALDALRGASQRELGDDHRRPITLRFRLGDASWQPADAESEVRFKVRLPRGVIASGSEGVTSWTLGVVAAFARILEAPELQRLADDQGSSG
jgi:hypothetical protein